MIPKTIHYCWFGGKPLPKLTRLCIRSWQRQCPGFTIKEWNETNAPIHLFPFAQQAFEAGKWAFVADVIRFYALSTEGGVYMDTDVELIKPLEPFLHHPAFCGYEKETNLIHTGILASEAHGRWANDILHLYDGLSFVPARMVDFVNTKLITAYMEQRGIPTDGTFRLLPDLAIYPSDYFCPMSAETHLIRKTRNTVCIHYFSCSWVEAKSLRAQFKAGIIRAVGEKAFRKAVNFFRNIKQHID